MVIRNHTCGLMEAQSRCLNGKASPELAEAMGIRKALSWVKNNKQHGAVVESDCLQIMQMVRSSYSSFSYFGRVVKE